MGLQHVFPESRRRGYAMELEKTVIAKTLQEGYTPFGQVEKGNSASMALQRKLGLAISDRLICWTWKQAILPASARCFLLAMARRGRVG